MYMSPELHELPKIDVLPRERELHDHVLDQFKMHIAVVSNYLPSAMTEEENAGRELNQSMKKTR